MSPSHRLLARQLRKHFGDAVPAGPQMEAFLQAVQSAYEQYDADRVLLDRAMKLSSDELNAALDDVRRQNALERDVLQKLAASVAALRADSSIAPSPESDLLRLAATIEQLVAERNAAKAALVAAKEAAESSNRAKSEFLAVMSHEIRTPLNAIIGFASLMTDFPERNQAENVAIIRQSAEHLLALLSDILDFSKIEAGRVEIAEQPVALAELIRGALELVRPDAAEKNLALAACGLEALPATVLGDAGRLRQVLVNLLSNAVKFTSQGAVTLSARAVCGPRSCRLMIEVADTGIGISEQALDKLFQAFSQVDSSNIREHGGTGLGLAISRRLAEIMGGTLEVRSTLGTGSTFTFTVPLLLPKTAAPAAPSGPPPAPAAAAESAPLPPSAAPAALPPPLRILVAEDNDNNRRLMRVLLETDGHTCTFAVNGTAALRALTRPEDFDAAFIDIQMPEVDGLAVATEFRRTTPPECPPYLIALSAAVRPEDRACALAAGMHEFLGKPAPVAQIRAALDRARDWLARHRA